MINRFSVFAFVGGITLLLCSVLGAPIPRIEDAEKIARCLVKAFEDAKVSDRQRRRYAALIAIGQQPFFR